MYKDKHIEVLTLNVIELQEQVRTHASLIRELSEMLAIESQRLAEVRSFCMLRPTSLQRPPPLQLENTSSSIPIALEVV